MAQIFDKVIVLYEGRQIYFGPTNAAKEFFTSRGFVCPPRQTTADFLTSLTNPAERVIADGYEGYVPRTADDFARVWNESPERQELLQQIAEYNAQYPLGGDALEKFKHSRRQQQSKSMYVPSSYVLPPLVTNAFTGASSLRTRSQSRSRSSFALNVDSSASEAT